MTGAGTLENSVPDLGTLVGEIRGDIHRGTDFDDRIKTAIRAAIRHYRTERLGFNTTRSFVTTSASAEYMELPADFIEIDSLRFKPSENRRVLYEKTFDWIDDHNIGTQSAQPCHYAIQQRQLRLYPPPDRTYTLLIAYQFDLTDISLSASDGAMNAWLDEGYDLIKQHALADLHANYIRAPESAQQAAVSTAQETTIFNGLKNRAMRDQSTGRIRPHCV